MMNGSRVFREYRFILEGHTPVPCSDMLAWGQWYESANRHVAKTERDGVIVSTVFLALDHAFGGPEPQLFETMVFHRGESRDAYTRRYSTWDEAKAGHRETCLKVWPDL